MMGEIASGIFLVTGSFFIFISGIGLLKMPDLLSRAHTVTKALTLGVTLILTGMFFHFQEPAAAMKIAIAILFQFFTIPLAGHILALLAYTEETSV